MVSTRASLHASRSSNFIGMEGLEDGRALLRQKMEDGIWKIEPDLPSSIYYLPQAQPAPDLPSPNSDLPQALPAPDLLSPKSHLPSPAGRLAPHARDQMRHGDAEADQAEEDHHERTGEDDEEGPEHAQGLRRKRLPRGDDQR